MKASSSSRFCSICALVLDSRFRRTSGSVFEQRTLNLHFKMAVFRKIKYTA